MMDKFTGVKIFGTEYPLKGEADREYIEELANYVDKKMKEIAEQSSLVSTAKIAVLAALRIADELYQLKQSKGGTNAKGLVEKRVRKLIEMIDRQV